MRRTLALLIVFVPGIAVAQQGAWETPPFPFGPQQGAISAIHLIHVYDPAFPTGRIIAITREPDCPGVPPDPCGLPDCDPSCRNPCGTPRGLIWTPPLLNCNGVAACPDWPGTFTPIPNCRTDMFCAGHSALPDGRLLLAGGNFANAGVSEPTDHADVFSPWYADGSQWNNPAAPASMAYGRFYPTCTTIADGRVLVTSGTVTYVPPNTARIPELYTAPSPTAPSGIWAQLPTAEREQPEYPWMFLLPDGNLVDAGPGESRILLSDLPPPDDSWVWRAVVQDPTWPSPPPLSPGSHGSAVMYEPGKIMKCGGGDPAKATTFVTDLSESITSPKWIVADNMNFARRNHNLVMLPDGKVLAVGGNTSGFFADPVYNAEVFDPSSGKWTVQPASDSLQPRGYHSTAVLLRDGRVVSAGGQSSSPTAQIFQPHYITSGAPRPVIDLAPSAMQYAGSYSITYLTNNGNEATKACLIRLAAVTHGFDQDQRYVPLQISNFSAGQITVQAPASGGIAPPGYYMLFILSEYAHKQYAPCTFATYVQVGP